MTVNKVASGFAAISLVAMICIPLLIMIGHGSYAGTGVAFTLDAGYQFVVNEPGESVVLSLESPTAFVLFNAASGEAITSQVSADDEQKFVASRAIPEEGWWLVLAGNDISAEVKAPTVIEVTEQMDTDHAVMIVFYFYGMVMGLAILAVILLSLDDR